MNLAIRLGGGNLVGILLPFFKSKPSHPLDPKTRRRYIESVLKFGPILRELTQWRRYGYYITFFLFIALMLGLHIQTGIISDPVDAVVLSGFLSVVIGFAKFGLLYADFRPRYKNELVREVITDIDPDLRYFPDVGMSREEFNQLRLFGESNRFSSEDLIEGNRGEIAFRISDVHARKRTNHGKKNSERTLFKGEAFVFTFKRPFKSPLYIAPDFMERNLGSFGKWIQNNASFDQAEVVRLDSPEFERYYKVMSSDPIHARYVLTPRFMEKLVALAQDNDGKVYIECVWDKMYVLLYNRRDKFEPAIDKETILNNIAVHIANIEKVLEVAEILEPESHHINVNAL